MRYIFTEIKRGDLPALERAGSEAIIVPGALYIVTLSETRAEWATLDGGIPSIKPDLKKLLIGSQGTVLIMGLSEDGVLGLVDVLAHGGHSYQARPWMDREVILKAIKKHIGLAFGKPVVIPEKIQRAFIRSFDLTVRNGGIGLIVRKPGNSRTYICQGE